MSGPVVVGVDGTQAALEAVRWADLEAIRHRVPLRLVHGCEVGAKAREPVAAGAAKAERGWRWLAEAAARTGATAELVPADAVESLVAHSRRARMVVLGSRGAGLEPAASVALAVTERASCPVVVVRAPEPDTGRVVVGVDGSGAGERALAFAFAEAALRGATLRAVHTWSDLLSDRTRLGLDRARAAEEGERLLAERLAGWSSGYPSVTVERVVEHDRPVRALLRHAARARLLVVGSRGRELAGSGMLLGSTSRALVHHSPCPLAVVRPVGASR